MRSVTLEPAIDDMDDREDRPYVGVQRGRGFVLLIARRLMLAILLTLSVAAAVQAMPLDEYRERIHKAADDLSSVAEMEARKNPKEWDLLTERVDAVRKAFPLDETLEWDGGSMHVNNAWLDQELRNYARMPFVDARRKESLQRVIERLLAMEERMDELDWAGTLPDGTPKEVDKARLAEISSREIFKPKPPQENIFQRVWKRFREWISSLFPGGGGLAPGSMSWFSFIAMVLIFGLVAGVLGYAVSKLVPLIQLKLSKGKPKRREARIVLGERLAPDQTAADLLAEAEALARRGELRSAIRKAYIALLCELGDRKIIALAQHKTNRDYLRAVRGKRALLDEMQKLTSSFENHWYGSTQTSDADWAAFRTGYEKVLSS